TKPVTCSTSCLHAATRWGFWRKIWTLQPASSGEIIPKPTAWSASSTPPCGSVNVGRKHYEASRRGLESRSGAEVGRRGRWTGSRRHVGIENIRRYLVRLEWARQR